MKPDKLNMAVYYDTYGDLLTDKQRDCLDLYCNQDYTLAEIAELQGTSRQSVYDAISRAQAQLLRYEEVTRCIARDRRDAEIAAEMDRLAEALSRLAPETAQAVAAAARKLKE